MSSLGANARWAALQELMRSNYWLLPTLMVTLSLVLSFLSLAADRRIFELGITSTWLYQGSADGARSLLSSLAGATLTLAGVVFSMNLVALTMASQQFGPRLLYNFVRDVGSQFTLGTFTSVFIYCIVVLREVKEPDALIGAFIPYLSVTVAGMMALCGMAVLIYYVHHVAVQIQAPMVVANVGRELEYSIRREFQTRLSPGQDRTDYTAVLEEREIPDFSSGCAAVLSPNSGYVLAVDFQRLLVLATRYDLTIKLLLRAGHFAIEGTPVMAVCPAERVSERLAHMLRDSIVVGRHRSATQDIEFVVNELCEVAVRAMSPAINDPFTCISCIDWLSASMEELFQRDTPAPFLCDADDNVRIVWHPITHSGVMGAAFDQIRQFGQKSPAVMMRMLEAYARIAAHAQTESERASLRKHADMAMSACRINFNEPNDVADAEERYRKVLANLAVGSQI